MAKKLIALILLIATVSMFFSACNTAAKTGKSRSSEEEITSESMVEEDSPASETMEQKISSEETERSEQEKETADKNWKQAYHDILVNPETYVFSYKMGDNSYMLNGKPWVFDYSLMDLTGDGIPELYIHADYFMSNQALVGIYQYKQGELQSLVPGNLDDYTFSHGTSFYEDPDTKQRYLTVYAGTHAGRSAYAFTVTESFTLQYKLIYSWSKDAMDRDYSAPHPSDENIYYSRVGYDSKDNIAVEASGNPTFEAWRIPQQLIEDYIEERFPQEYLLPAQAHFQGEGPLTSEEALAFLAQEGVPPPETHEKEKEYPSFTPVSLPENSTKEVYTTVDLLFEEPFENAGMFFNGYCPVQVDGKWGIINRQGEFTAPPIWEIMQQHDGKHAVVGLRKNLEDADSRMSGYIDYDGSFATGTSEGITIWVGVIDMNGNLVQPFEVMESGMHPGPDYPYFVGGSQPRSAYFYDFGGEPVHESQSYFLPLEQATLNSHEDDIEYRGVEYPVFRNGSPSGHELFLFNELSEDKGALRVPLYRYVLRTKSGAAILPTDKKYVAIHNLSDKFFLVGELTNELDYVTKVVDQEYNTIIAFDKHSVALPGSLHELPTLKALYYGESFVLSTPKGDYIVGIVEKEKGAPYLIDKPWYNDRKADGN